MLNWLRDISVMNLLITVQIVQMKMDMIYKCFVVQEFQV